MEIPTAMMSEAAFERLRCIPAMAGPGWPDDHPDHHRGSRPDLLGVRWAAFILLT